MSLITRVVGANAKGSELTFAEMDNNFLYLEGMSLSSSYFATTGSNNFNGNQVISGSVILGYPGNVAFPYSFVHGINNTSTHAYSHAEGLGTLANNFEAHSEGQYTIASGISSHAEGNQTIADGEASHAEGVGTLALGDYSHAEGIYTVAAAEGQTVVGQYNILNNTSSLFVIGNGSTASRQDLARFDPISIAFSGSLILDVSVSQSFNLVAGTGNSNGYVQINVQNHNTGSSASSDLVATADNGTESTYYVDLGINSSRFSNYIGGANDAYLYTTGSNLYIGNTTPSKSVYFFAGNNATSTIMQLSSSQVVVMPYVSSSLNFANDAAAAAAGIPKGGLYHTSGTIKIRLT